MGERESHKDRDSLLEVYSISFLKHTTTLSSIQEHVQNVYSTYLSFFVLQFQFSSEESVVEMSSLRKIWWERDEVEGRINMQKRGERLRNELRCGNLFIKKSLRIRKPLTLLFLKAFDYHEL